MQELFPNDELPATAIWTSSTTHAWTCTVPLGQILFSSACWQLQLRNCVGLDRARCDRTLVDATEPHRYLAVLQSMIITISHNPVAQRYCNRSCMISCTAEHERKSNMRECNCITPHLRMQCSFCMYVNSIHTVYSQTRFAWELLTCSLIELALLISCQ